MGSVSRYGTLPIFGKANWGKVQGFCTTKPAMQLYGYNPVRVFARDVTSPIVEKPYARDHHVVLEVDISLIDV